MATSTERVLQASAETLTEVRTIKNTTTTTTTSSPTSNSLPKLTTNVPSAASPRPSSGGDCCCPVIPEESPSSQNEASLLPAPGPKTPGSPCLCADGEFVNSEFYIDESLPSSATSERYQRQQQQQQLEIRQLIADGLAKCGCQTAGATAGSYDEGAVILLLQVLVPPTGFFSFIFEEHNSFVEL